MPDLRPFTDETTWRWRLAKWLDASPWTCWANLAVFAMGWFVWPWEPFWKGAKCRREAAERGSCWCCKFCEPRQSCDKSEDPFA